MINITNMIARSQLLANKIAELEDMIKKAPEGTLIARARSSSFYYTRKLRLPDGSRKELYLGKDQKVEAVKLAYKLFAERELPRLREEKALLNTMIRFYSQENSKNTTESLHPGIRQLLSARPLLTNEAANIWKHAPYIRNEKYPEQLRFSTVLPNLKVRSKAEADIVSRLEYYGAPYHYEELITIDHETIAIDFKCLNARTGQTFWWDHRGMMDDADYVRKTMHCEALFARAGIIPWVNLLITTETKQHPLDLQWVDTIIQHYLL